jgi:hypothetical protein
MFIDWTVSDATAVNTVADLTIKFTLNLYNANLSTTNTVLVDNNYYPFVPYLTMLNADSATIFTTPFDAIVIPMVLYKTDTALTAQFNQAGNYAYTTPDWYASDYTTVTLRDTTNNVSVTARAAAACDVQIAFDTNEV